MSAHETHCEFCQETERHSPTCPAIDSDQVVSVDHWRKGFAQGMADDTETSAQSLSQYPFYYQEGYQNARRKKYEDIPSRHHA